MGRVLQCLVCITAMTSLAMSQRGDYQRPSQFVFPARPHESLQGRNLHRQPITANLYARTSEAIKYNIESDPRNKREAINDQVVFPDELANKKREGPKITDECKMRGYCLGNEVENYPAQEVERIAKERQDKPFQMDKAYSSVKIAQRLGGESNDVECPLCAIDERIIYPHSLPDEKGEWWLVVNRDHKPLQGFLSELCVNETTPCFSVPKITGGFSATCEQKYIYRLMEAFDKNNNRVQKLLRLPGCCSYIVYETRNGENTF